MAELARLGIVHRDLVSAVHCTCQMLSDERLHQAARNVLVGRSLNCKIADYGLSRTMAISGQSNTAYYKMSSSKPLPVRWMVSKLVHKPNKSSLKARWLQAPSSVLDRKYDSSTDVWSFGCVCIEIWTAGEVDQPTTFTDGLSSVALL